MNTEAFALALEIYLIFSSVNGYSLNTNNVIVISSNNSVNEHFSYSLLLQKGVNPVVIVGAPRNNARYLMTGSIETVYKCTLTEENHTCEKLFNNNGRTIDSKTTNGNFFGMSLDGEDHVDGALVACAPRTVTLRSTHQYLRGYCIYMTNTSQVIKLPSEIKPLNSKNGWFRDSNCCDAKNEHYYDFAFAMAGFDLSFYSENKREVLLGAPGVKKFNGATISYSIDDQGTSLLPSRSKPVQIDEDTYFGYSVTTAKFRRGSNMTWFVAGAPRSNNLKGKVTIYFYDVMAKEKMHIVATFQGEEVGSYFGATILAIDVTNDGYVDLLVGAPMAARKTWDEGCVFFYRSLNENSFLQSIKLTGSSQNGSRFGSAIVSLGDYDLDGFNDVAISAPYEDNGRGAVYIYKGSSAGLTDHYSQRLIPEDFNYGNSISVKGFGMGISRGSDIDNNGHNDIAIGAYKTDQVFVIKSYSIIDYRFSLTSSISSITSDTSFDMRFCLFYTKRSDKNILPSVKFNLTMDLDYRSIESKIVDHIVVNLGKRMCKNYQVQIRPTMIDISPFQIDFKLYTETANIIAHGESSMELQIPYSHGCGSNNICETDLSIELVPESRKVVIGLDKQMDVTIKVNNYGEPAYKCEVQIAVIDGIELRKHKDCTKNSKNYTCLMSERLIGFIEKEFIFDIKDIMLDIQAITILVEVNSLGRNKGGYNHIASLNIPIILDSTPLIIGKSTPENVELESKSNMNDLEVVHQFSVGKTGPSPLKLDVNILLPMVKYNGENVFDILEIKGNIDTIQVPCTLSMMKTETDFNDMDDIKILQNRTILLSCNTAESCQIYRCQREYLYNTAQVAIFEVKLLIKSSLLVSKYKQELKNKDLIALLPVMFQNSPSGRVSASSLFLIFVDGIQIVPLWVYLLAPTIGVILLLLMAYGLYRCHFFDRVYKDKLDQEKILGSNDEGSVEDEIFDDVVFRSMKETKETKYF